jgi:hypothetical protein
MINKQNTKMKTPLFGTSLIYRHNVLFYGYFITSEIVIRLDQSIVYKQFNLNCNCFKNYECNHLILVDHADLEIIWFGKYDKKNNKSVAKQINVL